MSDMQKIEEKIDTMIKTVNDYYRDLWERQRILKDTVSSLQQKFDCLDREHYSCKSKLLKDLYEDCKSGLREELIRCEESLKRTKSTLQEEYTDKCKAYEKKYLDRIKSGIEEVSSDIKSTYQRMIDLDSRRSKRIIDSMYRRLQKMDEKALEP